MTTQDLKHGFRSLFDEREEVYFVALVAACFACLALERATFVECISAVTVLYGLLIAGGAAKARGGGNG